jgi:hypothetical protein
MEEIFQAMKARGLVKTKTAFLRDWLCVHRSYFDTRKGDCSFKVMFRLYGKLQKAAHPDIALKVFNKMILKAETD